MRVIQVFEHERVRIGEKRNGTVFTESDFLALAKLNERHENKYFTSLHRGIRFSTYVGVVQIPGLLIEILPKADDVPGRRHHLWRNILLEMLAACKFANYATIGSAGLSLKSGTILDVYIAAFLKEAERLLHYGLVREYSLQEGEVKCWKGRVMASKNLRNLLVHQERVYAEYQVYGHQHLFNQILRQALLLTPRLSTQRHLLKHAEHLIAQFPDLEEIQINTTTFNRLRYNRNTAYYQNSMKYAQLILCNYVPDLQYGKYNLFLFLFNMNELFEAFIYQELKKVENRYGIKVEKQVSAPFWAKKTIRPDILLYHEKSGNKYVIDTKWKKLKTYQPAAADLRQMFVYNQYFNANRGLLLYPAVYPLDTKTEAYRKPKSQLVRESHQEIYCTLGFIDLLDSDGKLNRKSGEKIIQMLGLDV